MASRVFSAKQLCGRGRKRRESCGSLVNALGCSAPGTTARDRQSKIGTGSVASVKFHLAKSVSGDLPVPFFDGSRRPHLRKKGTGTVAATFLPLPYRFAPRSQSRFSANLAL